MLWETDGYDDTTLVGESANVALFINNYCVERGKGGKDRVRELRFSYVNHAI